MAVRVFQIYYDEATRKARDADFEPLDNSANERPDWYEYWPMRAFLERERLDEGSHYGFFSPLFYSKTRLRGREVLDFAEHAPEADVVTFSPHPCHIACFYNVFEQGATFFPGFLEVARAFLDEVQPGLQLERLVNHARNTVYSNYFVARPSFWREWRVLFERLFRMAETPGSALHEGLNRPVVYAKDDGDEKPAQMKIMLMERVAALILATRPFRVRNYDPFRLPLSRAFVGRLDELKALDALKVAYTGSGEERLLREFAERRDRLLAQTIFR